MVETQFFPKYFLPRVIWSSVCGSGDDEGLIMSRVTGKVMSGTHQEAETDIWVPLRDTTFNITNKSSKRKTTSLELQEHLVSLGLTSAAWYGFLFIIHFHGFMHYICADDSNILSSWPEWPIASTVFPLGWLSDTRNSASTKTLSPWSSAHNLLLLWCALSPGIAQSFTQEPILESLDTILDSWALCFYSVTKAYRFNLLFQIHGPLPSSLPHSLASYYHPTLLQDPPSLSPHPHSLFLSIYSSL